MGMTEKNIDYSIILYQNIIKQNCKNSKKENTKFAKELTKKLIASRLLYLLYQMENDPDFSPRNFLISQLNRNSIHSKLFFVKLLEEDVDVDSLLNVIKTKIGDLSVSVGLDEAHVFEIDLVFKDNFFSSNEVSRGLLGPFKNSVNNVISLELIKFAFYAGTSVSIAFSDIITSGTESFEIVSDFPYTSSIETLFASLRNVLNVEMNDLKKINKDHYIGRSKLTFLPLKYIPHFLKFKKEEILQKSFISSFDKVSSHIYEKLKDAKNRSNIIAILREIYFTCLRNMKYFSVKDLVLTNADIIDVGILNLHKHGQLWFGEIQEPIALKWPAKCCSHSTKYSLTWNKRILNICTKL
jgi:hypothetical protein